MLNCRARSTAVSKIHFTCFGLSPSPGLPASIPGLFFAWSHITNSAYWIHWKQAKRLMNVTNWVCHTPCIITCHIPIHALLHITARFYTSNNTTTHHTRTHTTYMLRETRLILNGAKREIFVLSEEIHGALKACAHTWHDYSCLSLETFGTTINIGDTDGRIVRKRRQESVRTRWTSLPAPYFRLRTWQSHTR